MNQGLLKLVAVFSVTFSMNAVFAAPVESCKNDSLTSERIAENTTPSTRVDVFNSKNEVVGAFDYDPSNGNLNALYLCGANSGYYYAEGNVSDGADSIYNDEYDAEVDSTKKGNLVKVTLSKVTFSGEPEYADYPPFSTVFFFKSPVQ